MPPAAFDLAAIGAGLSFAAALDELSTALDESGSVVVSAPPGTGKTTLVPPLLASRSTGRVIVTQPRRVAARAAARRLAQLDGSPLGSRVGFTVRGERSAGPQTRVEFVTAGVLLRRMIDDPGLEGVDAVIIDEVHERALETDLLIGLLSEVRELRDDLVVVAMSATLDAARIATVLGTNDLSAAIVDHDVPAFPLTERWAPSPTPRLDERGVTWGFSTTSPAPPHQRPSTCTARTPTPTCWCSRRAPARCRRSPAASVTRAVRSTCGSCTARFLRPSRMP